MSLEMSLVANVFRITGRTVADDTGLVSDFDINFHWSQEPPPGSPQADTNAPLFGAIREQLGLRLSRMSHRGSDSELTH